MRKILTASTMLAVMALFTFGGAALAGPGCGSKSADATCSSYSKSACSEKAGAKSAELSCSTKDQAAASDFFLSSYINVKTGMDKGCSASCSNAVSNFKAGVKELIESGEATEHEKHLKNLVQVLDAWPSESDAQQASFQKLSNWTIGYMEAFPERCEGAEVKTCPDSGHRWVEIKNQSGDSSSS